MEKTIRVERKFTDEERAELCSSPYVASAMSNLLKFTLEFKRIAYQEMLEGKTMTEIFREHGIDPEILGSSRINYYAEEIRKWINSGKSFEEIHNKPKRKIVRPVVTSPQKRFTSDEQIELLCNPYVSAIIDDHVYFTLEFKRIAYHEMLKGEKLVREIFQEYGISPAVLGKTRIMNFAASIKSRIKNGKTFDDKGLDCLLQNPYVFAVTGKIVTFTEEFKDLACRELAQGQKSMREIFQEHDIDPEILGDNRIQSFVKAMSKRTIHCKNPEIAYNNTQETREEKQEQEAVVDMEVNNFNEGNICLLSEQQGSNTVVNTLQADQETEQEHCTISDRRLFTQEQIAILSQNQYVLSVTEKRLVLTREFREKFFRDYQSGKKPGTIFSDSGFDIRILGNKRIRETSRCIRNEYNGTGQRKKTSSYNESQVNTSDELKQLRNEVNYLRQENEFLKKISLIRITGKSLEC